MGGRKRKISIEKRETKEQRSVTFSKRRRGLFKKASELCLLCGAHVAVLAAPPSNNSNPFFYSFGHSSVDNVIHAFLENRSPRPLSGDSLVSLERAKKALGSIDSGLQKNYDCLGCKKEGSGFWWEDEDLDKYEKPEDLRVVIERMRKLKDNVTCKLDDIKSKSQQSLADINLDDFDFEAVEKVLENLDNFVKPGDELTIHPATDFEDLLLPGIAVDGDNNTKQDDFFFI